MRRLKDIFHSFAGSWPRWNTWNELDDNHLWFNNVPRCWPAKSGWHAMERRDKGVFLVTWMQMPISATKNFFFTLRTFTCAHMKHHLRFNALIQRNNNDNCGSRVFCFCLVSRWTEMFRLQSLPSNLYLSRRRRNGPKRWILPWLVTA